MKNSHWENFYKRSHVITPSSFAKVIRKAFSEKLIVYDLGCGNGRDSYYLGKTWTTFGIDNSICPDNKKNVIFFNINAEDIELENTQCLFYMRFFVHSINDKCLDTILSKQPKYIAMEVRSNKDKPLIYKNHKRYLRSGKKLIDIIYSHKYELMYYIESTGLAKYKNEDPVIIRIIAKKK